MGYVSSVFPSKAEAVKGALKTAQLIASKSPVAVQGTKHIIDYSRDHSIEDGLRYTATWNSAMLQTEDVKKAILSGVKKTTPTFTKL